MRRHLKVRKPLAFSAAFFVLFSAPLLMATYDPGGGGWVGDQAGGADLQDTVDGVVNIDNGDTLKWSSATELVGQANGYLILRNDAGNSFSGLRFGGATASYPMLFRDATNLRLIDASAGGFTTFKSGAYQLDADKSIIDSSADGYIELTDAAGTSFTGLRFGGTTSSFPMLVRNTSALEVKYADNSDYGTLRVANIYGYEGANYPWQIDGGGTGGLEFIKTYGVSWTENVSNSGGTKRASIGIQGTSAPDYSIVVFGAASLGSRGSTIQLGDAGTKPACAVGYTGTVWMDDGAANISDTFEVCDQNNAGSYNWRSLKDQFGHMYVSSAGTVTITGSGTWDELNGTATWSAGKVDGFDLTSEQLVAEHTGQYEVSYDVSFNGTASTDYHFTVATDGGTPTQEECTSRRDLGTTDTGNTSGHCIIDVTAAEAVYLMVEQVGGSTQNIDVEEANLVIRSL